MTVATGIPATSTTPHTVVRTAVVLVDHATPRSVLSEQLADVRATRRVVVALGTRPKRRRGTPPLPAMTLVATPDNEVEHLIRLGTIDLVVDLRGHGQETRRARWRRLFLLLAEGGQWRVARLGPGDLRRTERRWLLALSDGVGIDSQSDRNRANSIERESIESVSNVNASAETIVLTKQHRHVVKVGTDEADRLVHRRDPDVHVTTLVSLPAQRFVSRSRVVTHTSTRTHLGLNAQLDVPRMTLRHYTGPLVYGGNMLVHTANTLLNESFRFYRAGNPTHPLIWNYSPRISRIRPSAVPDRSLTGEYYLVDPQFSGHFGHLMTELVGRLWAWDAAKERSPGLKVLLKRWKNTDAVVERTLLNGYGIPDEDITIVDGPAHVRSLYAPSIMWHNWPPHFAHPELTKVWRRLAARIVDRTAPRHDKIFVSRPGLNHVRSCRNADRVEALFAERGFTIVYPELYPIAEQAAMFAHATTVAGFGGSGMFNLMYSQQVKQVIVLTHESYTARNELLYALLLGCDIDYFWSAPEVDQPAGGWNMQAFQSGWSFDFERNGADLERLLDVGGN